MPAFTNESMVRTRFLLPDPDALSSELIELFIADTHAVLLAELDPAFENADPTPTVLALGETLLAGARVLRAIASYETLLQRAHRLGTQAVQPGGRVAAFHEAARLAEEEAWLLLGPFLRPRSLRAPAAASATKPVLGGTPS